MFQVLALIPGTSRSGATILGGIMIGASRFVATEFSFFLGIPTMFGASIWKIYKFLKVGNAFDLQGTVILLTGTIVSFIVSVLAIRFLMNYIKRNDFTFFGWYRIVLGAVLIVYWLVSFIIKTLRCPFGHRSVLAKLRIFDDHAVNNIDSTFCVVDDCFQSGHKCLSI